MTGRWGGEGGRGYKASFKGSLKGSFKGSHCPIFWIYGLELWKPFPRQALIYMFRQGFTLNPRP